nr:MAG TPA: hypothetical protein [Caudoviricetes sp.]
MPVLRYRWRRPCRFYSIKRPQPLHKPPAKKQYNNHVFCKTL